MPTVFTWTQALAWFALGLFLAIGWVIGSWLAGKVTRG